MAKRESGQLRSKKGHVGIGRPLPSSEDRQESAQPEGQQRRALILGRGALWSQVEPAALLPGHYLGQTLSGATFIELENPVPGQTLHCPGKEKTQLH